MIEYWYYNIGNKHGHGYLVDLFTGTFYAKNINGDLANSLFKSNTWQLVIDPSVFDDKSSLSCSPMILNVENHTYEDSEADEKAPPLRIPDDRWEEFYTNYMLNKLS